MLGQRRINLLGLCPVIRLSLGKTSLDKPGLMFVWVSIFDSRLEIESCSYIASGDKCCIDNYVRSLILKEWHKMQPVCLVNLIVDIGNQTSDTWLEILLSDPKTDKINPSFGVNDTAGQFGSFLSYTEASNECIDVNTRPVLVAHSNIFGPYCLIVFSLYIKDAWVAVWLVLLFRFFFLTSSENPCVRPMFF